MTTDKLIKALTEAFMAKLERFVGLHYPVCPKCKQQIKSGDLCDTTGNEHVYCEEPK